MHCIPVALWQICNIICLIHEKQTYTATVARPEMCVYLCLVSKYSVYTLYSAFLGIKKVEPGGIYRLL